MHIKHSNQRNTCFLTAPRVHPLPRPIAFTTGNDRRDAHFAYLPANQPVVVWKGKK